MRHTVQAGETLSGIAKALLGDARLWRVIADENDIEDPAALRIGTVLRVGRDAAAPVEVPLPSLTSEKRLALVHPELRRRVRATVRAAEADGIELIVTQGLRTLAEQQRLYDKGRVIPPIGNRYIVTKAKPGSSWHNYGLAVDLAPLDAFGKLTWEDKHPGWAAIGKHGRAAGLEWGGDWESFVDRPHLQLRAGMTLAQAAMLYNQPTNLPRTLAPVWAMVRP